MNSSQYKALQSLKRSHTELHHLIEAYQHSTPTEKTKADVAKIISQLSYSLANL
jgi:hypothetical protein